jgi:hypothetical protein
MLKVSFVSKNYEICYKIIFDFVTVQKYYFTLVNSEHKKTTIMSFYCVLFKWDGRFFLKGDIQPSHILINTLLYIKLYIIRIVKIEVSITLIDVHSINMKIRTKIDE